METMKQSVKQTKYSWLSGGCRVVMKGWNRKFDHTHTQHTTDKINNNDIFTEVLFTSGTNLVVLTWTSERGVSYSADKLKMGEFWFSSWMWSSQNRSFHKTIGILTKVFYASDPNLVILT